jgi:hypothetical protein
VTDKQPSLVQFSLRGSILIVAILSFACAVIAPSVRAWDSKRQFQLGCAAVVLLLSVTVTTGFACYRRRRAERNCRPIVRVPSPYFRRWMGLPVWLLACITIAHLGALLYILSFPVQIIRPAYFLKLFCVIACGMYVKNLLLKVWWGQWNQFDIGENGIIVFTYTFHPWKKLSKIFWDREAGKFTWGHSLSDRRFAPLQIPPEHRENLDAILKRHKLVASANNEPAL